MSILITILIIDTSVVKIYPFTTSQALSNWRIGLFIVIVIAYVLAQYFIPRFVKNKSKEIRSRKGLHLDIIHEIVRILQYSLAAILVWIVLQIVINSRYDVALLTVATTISYTLAVIILTLLSIRFISWHKSNRDRVVFLYGLSSVALAASAFFSLIFVVTVLIGLPAYVLPHYGFASPTPVTGSLTNVLYYPFSSFSILSFSLLWVATATLLSHYSHKVGKTRYWIVVSMPLVFFLIQFIPVFTATFFTVSKSDPVFLNIVYTLVFTLSKPVGGILFGIAFWLVTKSLSRSNNIRDYMIIAAWGFVLLFTSDQAIVLVTASYPPFGLPSVSFMGLSAYMILIGIYSSAISVAQDEKLRKSIRKLTIGQSELLDSIGLAQMEQEIQQKVTLMTRKYQTDLAQETGLSTSLSDEEVKRYIDEVILEIKKIDHKRNKK